jgi:hypothetical protein
VWGQWGEMNQSLYAHMNNKRKMKKKLHKDVERLIFIKYFINIKESG